MSFYIALRKEVLQPCSVLYMRRIGAYGKENTQLMARFKDWLKAHHLYDFHTVILAIPLDDPSTTVASQCRYDVCIPKEHNLTYIPHPIATRTIPGGTYAVFQIHHTVQAMQSAWQNCFDTLNALGYQLDPSRSAIERYYTALIELHRCELCIPIL